MDSLEPLNLFRLDGRTAIVTGASSGLGVRFARVLHAVGAQVVIAARRTDRLLALADELPGTFAVTADLALSADRERLVEATLERFGRVDVLVNNAGISNPAPLERESLDDFRQAMEVNVTALWHLAKLSTPSMIANGGGSIVNIASVLGHIASSPIKQAQYCASKGAVVNMTRELGAQLARKGVRVNALCPGWFASEMTEGMQNEESQKWIAQMSPIPRMGDSHELDAALLLLTAPGNSFMTGQSVIVDGGWTAR